MGSPILGPGQTVEDLTRSTNQEAVGLAIIVIIAVIAVCIMAQMGCQ